MEMKRIIANVMLSVFAFGLCLAVGEAAFRVLSFDDQLTFDLDDQLYWVLRPNQAGFVWMGDASFRSPLIHINSLGLRGAEVTTAPGKRIRILMLGDSYTFGSGVRDEETFGAVAERSLGRPDVDVINAGVPGYGVFQMQRMLERLAPILQPRVVVLTIPTGDVFRQPFADARAEREYLESERRRMTLRHYSRLGLFLYRRLYYLRNRLLGTTRSVPNQTDMPNDAIFGDLWNRDQARLRAMAEVCEPLGAQLVIMPWPQDTQPPAWNEALAEGVEHLATRQGVVALTGLDQALGSHASGQLVIAGDGHPSAIAHAVAGRYLADALRDLIAH